MTDLSLPDYTTDTATEYKTAIDEGFQNAERTAWSFAPHPITPTPNMTVDINPGAIWDAGTLTEKAAQTTSAFTAPVTNPRIDRIVVDEVTGTYSIVAGSEAASPTAPAIPAGKFPVCQIQFETTTTSIGYVATATVAAIVDERIPFVVSAEGDGKVVQIVSSSLIAGSSTTSTTAVDVTSANLAITPLSSSNKIIVMINYIAKTTILAAINIWAFQQFLRGATVLGAVDVRYLSAGSGAGGLQAQAPGVFIFEDSPATTSATTYKVQHRTNNASAAVHCEEILITLMEIKP